MLSSVGVRFSRAVLMVRGSEGVASAADFYQNAVGLQLTRHTDEWAELLCGNGFVLNLQAVTNEAQLSVGYSPILSFEVDNMDEMIVKCTQMGAHLDGPIQYPAHGKVASMRTPAGHVVGFFQPAI